MKTSKYGRGLLPTYFKIVGIAVILSSFVVMYLLKNVFTPEQKPIAKVISLNIAIIGLFFIAWTRDKIEDEMSVQMRFHSMAGAFLFGFMYAVLHPFIGFFLNDPELDISGQQLIMTMLMFFIFTYAIKRKTSK
jgi:cytochrome c biogenesis protein CcdA